MTERAKTKPKLPRVRGYMYTTPKQKPKPKPVLHGHAEFRFCQPRRSSAPCTVWLFAALSLIVGCDSNGQAADKQQRAWIATVQAEPPVVHSGAAR